MKHEKTFAAINKLKDVELELHRLKNALEMANRALEAQRPWIGLTDEEVSNIIDDVIGFNSCWGPEEDFAKAIEAKLKEKNNG
jgi:hypothetical protein